MGLTQAKNYMGSQNNDEITPMDLREIILGGILGWNIRWR